MENLIMLLFAFSVIMAVLALSGAIVGLTFRHQEKLERQRERNQICRQRKVERHRLPDIAAQEIFHKDVA